MCIKESFPNFYAQETLSVKEKRRLPTLPRVCSTIGAGGLNCSVRNGKRWDPATIATLMTIMTNHNNKHEHKRFTTNRNKHAIYRGELKLRARKLIRAISSARLWRHRLYTCTLSTSSSVTTLKGNLILWPASCLDAFSAYPIQTWIPGGAPGGTTGKPEVCPTRSSRTSVRATQISNAHDR